MTATYTPLANITLQANAGAVTFSGIPNTFRDIVAVVSTAAANLGAPGGNARNLLSRLNGDGSNVYTRVIMSGDGGTARSTSDTQQWLALDWYANTNNGTHVHVLQFMDYAATNKHKTVLNRATSTAATEAIAHRWPSNAAITSISFFYDQNSLATGSTLAIYGIA